MLLKNYSLLYENIIGMLPFISACLWFYIFVYFGASARHAYRIRYAPVAQLVEQLTLNQLVRGSSPCGCTFMQRHPLGFSPYPNLVLRQRMTVMPGSEVVPRPSIQPVILCLFFLEQIVSFKCFLLYGDDLASTGKERLRMAFRDFRVPRDYPVAR